MSWINLRAEILEIFGEHRDPFLLRNELYLYQHLMRRRYADRQYQAAKWRRLHPDAKPYAPKRIFASEAERRAAERDWNKKSRQRHREAHLARQRGYAAKKKHQKAEYDRKRYLARMAALRSDPARSRVRGLVHGAAEFRLGSGTPMNRAKRAA